MIGETTQGGSAGGDGAAAGGGAGSPAPATAGSAGAPGAADAGGAPAGGAAPAAGGDPAAAAAAKPYQPNFKYKVLKEEKELPEWARPFVTNADLEKQFRDTFERADGIEAVKQHRDALVQENTAMREEWAPLVQDAQQAVGFLQKKDYAGLFEFLGIPEIDVLKYAHHRLSIRENPAALAQEQAQRQLQQMQQQLQHSQTGQQQLAVQHREFMLDVALSRPESQAAVQAFDARVGKPGAFRAEVIRRGQAYAAVGQDVTVEQAVNEVLQVIGWQAQNTPSPNVQNGAGAAAPAAGAEPPAAGEPKATLPHLRAKGGSPVKKTPKSTDELRKLASQLG